MKLSNIAILAIRGSGQGIKERIAKAAGVTTATVYKWLSINDAGLTLAAALKVIREETGLTDDQILEEETVTEDQK